METETKIRGAVFDMDGLMVDTEKLYLRYWKEASAAFGYDMQNEHVYSIRSLARKYSIPKLKSFFGEDFPTEDVRKRRTELINAHIEKYGIDVKKGLFELLDYLKKHGVKLAVATATPRERALYCLGKISARDYFDAVICGDMIESGKPDPDIYLTAARELGLPPEQCAALEDSPNGIRAAHSAGCQAIMIPDMTPPDEETAPLLSAVYDDLAQAVSYFEGRV
ncbi:MAG: HAD family phosphatase [Ruminococcus sp.]|nr:HAD family phosphatase [Ruminococcus sp.]